MSILAIACSPSIAQNVQIGDSVALGDGFVFVWVEADDSGAPVRIGTTLDERVLALPNNRRGAALDLFESTSQQED